MRAGAGLTVRTSSSSRQYPGGAARDLVFTGLMTCALTALLISPISWDHHWVWLAPGLALLIDAGHRASRAWYALAAATGRSSPPGRTSGPRRPACSRAG